MNGKTLMVVSNDDMNEIYYSAKNETGFIKESGKRKYNKKVRVEKWGYSFNVGSIRQQTFMEKTCRCHDCGVVGNEWHLDNENNGPVMNMYYVDENGNSVLMTHVKIDKTKGETVENSDVLCFNCMQNRQKNGLL